MRCASGAAKVLGQTVVSTGGKRDRRTDARHEPCSLVPIGPQGHHDHRARDPGALASVRLSPVLALEIPLSWRPAADRRGSARADQADENRRRRMTESDPFLPFDDQFCCDAQRCLLVGFVLEGNIA